MRALQTLARVRWRKWLRVVHRDLGYVCVALILAYGLSGIAVNHIDDWNPNYSQETRSIDLGPVPPGDLATSAAYVTDKLGISPVQVRGQFFESAAELRVMLDGGGEARVMLASGRGTYTTIARRAVFFEVNKLHLNELKGAWTYVADAFAGALMLLALTGMVMMKGDRGIGGRGKYFVLAGLAVPVGFIAYVYA